jgi:TRAP-type mannitol/chloroaromatic compound transport system permease small subunit
MKAPLPKMGRSLLPGFRYGSAESGRITAPLLIFMVIFILVVMLVILRYLFNTTIVGGNEATVQLFIHTTALGAAV